MDAMSQTMPDPFETDFAASVSQALAVPNASAQTQLAAMRNRSRRQLDDAELTLADLAGQRIALEERFKRAKVEALDRHKADEAAYLSRDAAAIERLKDALAQAEQTFAANAEHYRAGRQAIITDHDNDLANGLRAIDDQVEAARMVKIMAEAALSADARVVS